MRSFARFLLLFGLLVSYDVYSQADTSYHGKKSKRIVRLEASLFYALNFNDAALLKSYYTAQPQLLSMGGGISFLPEIKSRKSHFSFLTGLSTHIMRAKNYRYTIQSGLDYGTIYDGSLVRLQIPIWFRWTYGQRLPFFFQLGFGGGTDIVQGHGDEYIHGGVGRLQTINGHKLFITGFINVLNLGMGVRKKISPMVAFTACLDGSPITYQFDQYFQQYVRFNIGFSFSTKKK